MTSATVRQARDTARRHGEQIARDKVREALERHGVRQPTHRFTLRLWIPVALFWVLAAPLLILSPILLVWRINPARAAGLLAQLLSGLHGLSVEVITPDADIRIHLF